MNESRIQFRGFLSVYALDEEKLVQTIPASLTEDSKLTVSELKEEQHFTQPPAHFTEASLVKAMEDLGIGRPSTYAPTISLLSARKYVEIENCAPSPRRCGPAPAPIRWRVPRRRPLLK